MLPGLRTSHDWSSQVDVSHVESIRDAAVTSAAVDVVHLVLEVLAYALDEAREGTTSLVDVVLHPDDSIEVVDDGRGTDTRRDADGVPVVKPVMATRDLRFFDAAEPPELPDGLPRRGMSVVTALSAWLVHENRRVEGGWSCRYEHGLPVGPPIMLSDDPDGRTGTSVRFRPDPSLVAGTVDVDALRDLCADAPVPVVLSVLV